MDPPAVHDRRWGAASHKAADVEAPDGCACRGGSALCDPCAALADKADAAAVARARERLQEGQGEQRIRWNANRLLIRRIQAADAALQEARARTAAFPPAAEQLPPLAGGPVSPEAGRLTPRVQRRMFSDAQGPPAPGLSHFNAHCGISITALIRMQGSSSGTLDVSDKNLRVLIDDYRSRISVSAGLRQEDICWYLVTTWEVAPRMPISFGLGLTTAPCLASFFLFFFLIQVECALLLEEDSIIKVSDAPDSVPVAQAPHSAAPTVSSAEGPIATGTGPNPCNCCQGAPTPPSAPAGLSALVGASSVRGNVPCGGCQEVASGPPDVRESTARPPADSARAAPGRTAQPSGRASGWPGGADVQEESGESVGSHSRGSGEAGATVWDMWREGSVEDVTGGPEPQLRCGMADSLPLAATSRVEMEALVRRFTHRLPRRRIIHILELMLPSVGGRKNAGGPGGAGDAAVGGDSVPVGSTGESVTGDGSATDGGGGSGNDAPEQGTGGDGAAPEVLCAHHWEGLMMARSAMQDALIHVLDFLEQEEEPAWQLSISEHERDMQRVERLIQDFTLALVSLKAFCSQVLLTFGLMVAFPGVPEFCKVENMQVRLFKLLRLPHEQKILMAAMWADWTRNRSMLSLSLSESQLPMSIWSPHSTDLPPTLDALATAVASGGRTFRLRKLPERSHVPHVRPVGFFAPLLHGCGGTDTPETLPRRRFCAADGRLLLDSPAAWVLSRLVAAAPGMLGQCPVATIAAAETLRRLRAMHSMSLRLYLDVQSRVMPGDVMTGPQVMQFFWLPVQHGVGCADLLALCHLAYKQVHKDDVFKMAESIAL